MQQPIIVALLSLLCIGLVYFLNINSFAYVLQKIVILVILLPLYLAIFKKIGFDYLVDNFLEEFRVFLTWLCVLGLVIWSLSEVFGKIFPSIHVTYIWGSLNSGDGYFGLVFPLQEANLKNIQLYRFTLFFVEGPLANFVFLTALASELLLKLRPNWFSAFIFSLSSLLTFSTFGFILLPLIWVCWILFSSSGQRIRKKKIKK
ncbi:hypothetical protein OZX74_01585 [Bifidobacterium sp. ESL0798]|uniref:hypothetical protein n=1 Tax=Bifidobacterium sp. ESL0798 TaxID=2983235 RepID=UPI0023F9E392|nr:hypothetical protein [Bifidobacterium sp. ESL0798]WEV74277.1 hypothetical protein OZX74_01585 [Bifidobacterium sp. ESL0798]